MSGEPSPPANKPLVEFEAPPLKKVPPIESPKSAALPVVFIFTKSIALEGLAEIKKNALV